MHVGTVLISLWSIINIGPVKGIRFQENEYFATLVACTMSTEINEEVNDSLMNGDETKVLIIVVNILLQIRI